MASMTKFQMQSSSPTEKQNPIALIRRGVVLFLVTSLLALAGLGCNTTRGLGKDIERTGEKIQDGTK